MWSFEGDYRRKPQQRLGGASKSRNIERLDLLNQLKSDREERERQRRREAAAVTLQSWARGVLSQQHTKRDLRHQCDSHLALTKAQGISEASAVRLIALLIRIFHPHKDSDRILTTCQLVIREQRQLAEWVCGSFERWAYLLPRLVSMALQVITQPVQEGGSAVSHAAPLRLLEIVLVPESWPTKLPPPQQRLFLASLYSHLISKGYYHQVVGLLTTRVPEVYEPSQEPPTPLADALLHLLMKPLTFSVTLTDPTLLCHVLSEMCQQVLGGAVHSQISNYIIPCLASSEAHKLPMDRVVAVLATHPIKTMDTCPPPALLYSLLMLVRQGADFKDITSLCNYLQVIGELLGGTTSYLTCQDADVDSDDEEEDAMDSSKPLNPVLCKLAEECVSVVNSTEHVGWLLSQVERYVSPEVLLHFSRLTHHLLTAPSLQLHQCRLLYSVVVRRQLLRSMWVVLSSLQQGAPLPGSAVNANASFGVRGGTPLLQVMARGSPLAPYERDTLVPLLATFCATLTAVLSTLHDSEFLGQQDDSQEVYSYRPTQSQFPFSVDELVKMSASLRDVCVGLVELAHPDTRMSAVTDTSYTSMWAHCFKVCVGVVRQIHLRDTRRMFCPSGHWLSSRASLPLGNICPAVPFVPRTNRRQRRLFMPQRLLTRNELETEGPPLSVIDERRATILQELPFVFPFEARTQVFTKLVGDSRSNSQMGAEINERPVINVSIRRTHVYEDAFEKLSPNNEPNMRLRMRVRLMNAVGLNEVGIDGGGIFREFLSELLKTAFDPTRGFFLLTLDNTLYPNPGAHLIAENYQTHYYFIGRMLGKALYESLLVEVPLAGFFLSKLLGKSTSAEIHHLDSLDPELCRNLLSLKTYQGDVQDLGLDFTVLNSNLGQNTIEELIPNGANIPVNNENRIEYIYRMADYKLNKQIAKQSQAFKKGVIDVVPAEWLQMFDWRELQMLISGAFVPIDLEDLMDNTRYGGIYSTENATIQAFWQVLREFTETQKRQLLKFVTSCSRPPLLGFKELQPAFCIQPSGSEDRLPTASTCMNLLKLPEYKNEHTLKEKLLYAITSGSGFELS